MDEKSYLCWCGCGMPVKIVNGKPNRFIQGHHRRGKKTPIEVIIKMSMAHIGKKMSESAKQKMSESRKGFVVSEETRRKMSNVTKGKLNPFYGKTHTEDVKNLLSKKNWKGGKWTKQGYVQIREPRSKAKLEHVIVVENILGKPLPKGTMVHHIDGNRSNNTPDNLVVCENNSYHILLHTRQKAYKACGNPNWRKCSLCKQYDDVVNMRKNKYSYVHDCCHNAYKIMLRKSKRMAQIQRIMEITLV